MARLFHGPTGYAPRHLPFRRAALSFMRWQARRGLLNPLDATAPGSVWWRALNERLLRDGCEAVGLLGGLGGRRRRRRPCGAGWSSARDRRTHLVPSAQREHRGRLPGAPGSRGGGERSGAVLHERRAGARPLRARARQRAAARAGPARPTRPTRRPAARDGRRVPLAPPSAPEPLSAHARRGALHRRRAAARPDARLRGDRAATPAPVRVVRSWNSTNRAWWSSSATEARSTPGRTSSGTSGARRACRSQPGCSNG